ncbi:hypothetical protein GE09DRAFT_1225098 [Coniochaeta sp. 2T2.1]|nr:hypothetical protein GE09DRAFT_1225098 [Coniochaeta sp. 2T2.1]
MAQPIPFTMVKISSPFRDSHIKVSRKENLPMILSKLKSYGTWEAMRMKWKKGDPGVNPDILWDSDVGKYIEAAASMIGCVVDMLQAGAAICANIAAPRNDSWGRKKAMMAGAACGVVGAALQLVQSTLACWSPED